MMLWPVKIELNLQIVKIFIDGFFIRPSEWSKRSICLGLRLLIILSYKLLMDK